MKCPSCQDSVLVMTERVGIEIDYCPACRGVWLDRGELDKLIEKSQGNMPSAGQPVSPHPVHPVNRRYDSDDLYPHEYDQRYGTPRKKKGWLGQIFDM